MLGCRLLSLFCSIIFFISFALSEARSPKKHPSAVVIGTVYCDTCFQQDFSKASHFISGASVAVECGDKNSKPSFREVAKTNEHGEFKVHLPFSVSKHVKKIKGCSVKLISSSEPYCAVASTATASSIHLKSRKDGTHIFSAGFFTFKPLKQPELCDQKPIISKSKKLPNTAKLSSISDPDDPNFSPPIQDPPTSDVLPVVGNYVPPLPELPHLQPLPELPPLPPLPGLPIPSVPGKSISTNSPETSESSNEKVAQPRIVNLIPLLPPIPLLTTPSVFPPIPNPFQPPPSTLPPASIFPPFPLSILPPIFPRPPTPPPSLLTPFVPLPGSPPSKFPPPIPGLTPPPPAPFLPFPIPPFPFQPTPGLPGVPPAIPSSSDSEKTSP